MPSLQASLRGVFGPRPTGALTPTRKLLSAAPFLRLIPVIPGPRPPRSEAQLAGVIEGQVIPRLIRAHPECEAHSEAHSHEDSRTQEAGHESGTSANESFLLIALRGSVQAMRDVMDDHERSGASADQLFAALLAPTARRLVELWHEDRASHAEVTIALGRLRQLARGLREATAYNGDSDARAASAYFAPRPGEEQTFGLYLMGELFRWSGWRTTAEGAPTDDDIRGVVRGDWYDMLCLNVARGDRLDDLHATLDLVRMASRNQDLCILVRGHVFEERPALIDAVGADAAVCDAEDALNFLGEAAGHRAAA